MTSVNMRLLGKDYEIRDKLWKIVSRRNCIEKGLAAVPIRGCNDEKVNSIIPLLSSVPLDLIIVKTSKTSN